MRHRFSFGIQRTLCPLTAGLSRGALLGLSTREGIRKPGSKAKAERHPGLKPKSEESRPLDPGLGIQSARVSGLLAVHNPLNPGDHLT